MLETNQEPALDPIIVEVIRNALLYASEEMGIVVRNASRQHPKTRTLISSFALKG